DENRVRKWLAVEVALAQAQAELGLVPAPAALEIVRQARVQRLDLHALGAEIRATAHPLVPVLRALSQPCGGAAGGDVHLRDRIAEIGGLLVQVTGTLGKIANEIRLLQKTEVDELREPFHRGKVGSSTMPHKRNPSTAELVVALARLVRAAVAPLLEGLVLE